MLLPHPPLPPMSDPGPRQAGQDRRATRREPPGQSALLDGTLLDADPQDARMHETREGSRPTEAQGRGRESGERRAERRAQGREVFALDVAEERERQVQPAVVGPSESPRREHACDLRGHTRSEFRAEGQGHEKTRARARPVHGVTSEASSWKRLSTRARSTRSRPSTPKPSTQNEAVTVPYSIALRSDEASSLPAAR